MLQAPAEGRIDTESLRGIFVRTASGEMSPISNYITLTRIYGAENLTRFNLFQSIAVNGAPAPGYSSGQAIKAIREVAVKTLPVGYGLSAAKHRLRPIIMTSATMVLGLLPMIFATGVGSNGSRSLAIGIMGGMFFGTIALVYITPAIYVLLARRR